MWITHTTQFYIVSYIPVCELERHYIKAAVFGKTKLFIFWN